MWMMNSCWKGNCQKQYTLIGAVIRACNCGLPICYRPNWLSSFVVVLMLWPVLCSLVFHSPHMDVWLNSRTVGERLSFCWTQVLKGWQVEGEDGLRGGSRLRQWRGSENLYTLGVIPSVSFPQPTLHIQPITGPSQIKFKPTSPLHPTRHHYLSLTLPSSHLGGLSSFILAHLESIPYTAAKLSILQT